jgi:hypothetical protein
MEPPWVAHPELPRLSIGWRMGYGEETANRFYQWFSALAQADRLRFRREHPEPQGWEGYYQMIIDHPWLP